MRENVKQIGSAEGFFLREGLGSWGCPPTPKFPQEWGIQGAERILANSLLARSRLGTGESRGVKPFWWGTGGISHPPMADPKTEDSSLGKRCRIHPAGGVGGIPQLLNSPKIGGYRGLKED
jgi:hypothetical protein